MIAPPSEAAYGSLGDAERQFLYSLPHRVELHAHLNGSIPLHTLEELARERNGDGGESADIQNFRDGIQLEEIGECVHVFELKSSHSTQAFSISFLLYMR